MKLYLKDRVPANYNRATWVDVISQIESSVNPLILHFKGMASAPPTFGAHARCDWYQNNLPSPSGFFGWICTDSGTPGTWRGFGLIIP